MKKKSLLVSAIALLGLSVFLISCVKKECYCETSDDVSVSELLSDMKAVQKSSTSCSDMESKLRRSYGYRNISCHE